MIIRPILTAEVFTQNGIFVINIQINSVEVVNDAVAVGANIKRSSFARLNMIKLRMFTTKCNLKTIFSN